MLEVLRSDYIRTARSKGLREQDVVVRHALRAGLMPVISFTGPALAFLLTGTVVVERIFALPGLGNYFIQASLNRDEPLLIGIVAFIAMTLLLMNLLVDIAYATGFSSQANFNRAFRKAVGTTPSAYRAQKLRD